MATVSNFRQSRPGTFVVRRVAGKGSASYVRPVKAATRRCERMHMTKQEAEVFFDICENPSPEPIEMFDNLATVARWFKD